MRAAAIAMVGALIAHAGAGCKPPRVKPTQPVVAASSSVFGFGESPLTAFADEVAMLAVNAVEGRPLPLVQFPLWVSDRRVNSSSGIGPDHVMTDVRVQAEGEEIVRYTTSAKGRKAPVTKREVIGRVDRGQVEGKLRAPLKVLGFLVDVTAFLAADEQQEPVAIAETALFLGPTGLRILTYAVELKGGATTRLPSPLERLAEVFVPIVKAARSGALPPGFLSAEERRMLGSWATRTKVPDSKTRARYQAMLRGVASDVPSGYQFEEINVQVRDADGKNAFLRLRAERGPVFGLRRPPLVKIAPTPDF